MSAIHMAILLMLNVEDNSEFTFAPTISTNTSNYNLRSAALAAGWNGVVPLNAMVTIAAGVVVSADSTAQYAFDTGASFPAGSTLAVINNGTILGKGGAGGSHNAVGAAGGPAFRAQAAVSVTNNGRISGGGGGGGGGVSTTYYGDSWTVYGGGGGGGGGIGTGAGGAGHSAYGGANGSAGTWTTAGSGGSGRGDGGACAYADGGDGGGGGSYGAAGTASPNAAYGDSCESYNLIAYGKAGGAGGACTVGAANITWVVTGTRNGAIT